MKVFLKALTVLFCRFCGKAADIPLELDSFLKVIPVTPQSVEQRGAIFFVDFGADAYGNLRVKFKVPPVPSILTIRLGEKLAADGTIDRQPPGSVNFRELMARRTFAHLLANPTWPTEWSLIMPMIAEMDYQATGDLV